MTAAGTEQVTAEPLALVSRLCNALAAEAVTYCHWKSNDAQDRAVRGESDLDLLVSSRDVERFVAVIRDLDFKDARAPSPKHVPGVFHSYGLDEASGRLIHLHVHDRLVLGDDTTKNYRVPIEEAYLASVHRDGSLALPTPAPEFELVVFVIRMVLKHSTWDAIASHKGRLAAQRGQGVGFPVAAGRSRSRSEDRARSVAVDRRDPLGPVPAMCRRRGLRVRTCPHRPSLGARIGTACQASSGPRRCSEVVAERTDDDPSARPAPPGPACPAHRRRVADRRGRRRWIGQVHGRARAPRLAVEGSRHDQCAPGQAAELADLVGRPARLAAGRARSHEGTIRLRRIAGCL